jgi:hypothetical protein
LLEGTKYRKGVRVMILYKENGLIKFFDDLYFIEEAFIELVRLVPNVAFEKIL